MRGYKRIYCEKSQVRLHRHLVEKHLARKLKNDEIVHHKDGNIFNNALKNLEVMSKSEHMQIHGIGIKTRFKKRYNIKREDIINLYRDKPISAVANILGTSYGTILRRMKEYKIPRRKPGVSLG